MNESVLSRRDLLQAAGIGAVAVVAQGLDTRLLSAADAPVTGAASVKELFAPKITKLSEHLWVYHGPINVGIVRDGEQALLIDCGDVSVQGVLGGLGIKSVQQVLFTHHHRDQACGAHVLAAAGAKLAVPASERGCFDKVAAYWANPQSRWHLYNLHPHHLMLAEPVAVDAALAGGQTVQFGPARIAVLDTPGHTDGSVSYVVEVDGRKVVFCGDAIYDEGQVWDIHSLQKGTVTTDYHGFLGSRPQLTRSLQAVKAAGAQALVPSHGRIMKQPAKAIDLLIQRLDACYEQYVKIATLRWYYPKIFTDYAGREGHMAIRKGRPAPDCLLHSGTTWVLVSADKSALVMDVGNPRIVDWLRKLMADGQIKAVEGLWITHYHDDHVDGVEAFRKAFDCPCITDRHVAEVISDPPAWRLACISPIRARVDRPTADGQTWAWHEFQLTAYHLPGQTLYHSGLVAQAGELRMLFAGDSFSPGGIDDYCSPNRNWLGSGVGFDRCLELVQKIRPTHIFNPHINDAFDFTDDQCRFMRANLAQREKDYGQLFPWDHPNYGMDEPWLRCHPYEQKAAAGADASFRLVATNHSTGARRAAARAVPPRAWSAGKSQPGDWAQAEIAAKTEGEIRLTVRVPAGTPPGRYVIPVDVRYDRWTLPQITEAVVVV